MRKPDYRPLVLSAATVEAPWEAMIRRSGRRLIISKTQYCLSAWRQRGTRCYSRLGNPAGRTLSGTKKYDGVFGIWYGKGPGVDRCSDVFKHANMAGTSPHGGVIAIAGDDHIAKSSTAAHQSDHIFKACGLPVFFPSDVQGILDMGLHAFALSRFSGLWSGMKTIQEVVESSASVDVDLDRVRIILPEDFLLPEGGLHIRWPDAPLAQEARLMEYKWYAALAYIRANKLNHTVIQGPVIGWASWPVVKHTETLVRHC